MIRFLMECSPRTWWAIFGVVCGVWAVLLIK